ncbi:MAG: sigma-70 family RNA polymerase sigma factor [Phycisphaerae bacterium]|nr:sigma-70 family RNA polymerase sigma factor [Phycisphaerae bacterium]
MNTEQLRETIAQAGAGDARAYQRLLAGFGPRLYGYFYRATGRHHDAEDLLGELTLRLVRTLPMYRDQGRFEPWLFRIAANMVRDRIRRKKTRPQPASLSVEDEQGHSPSEGIPARMRDVDAGVLAQEASARLEDALQSLDETTRQMILMRHFGEMSFKDIADMFQCPLGTALAKVHRGMQRLREELEDREGTSP